MVDGPFTIYQYSVGEAFVVDGHVHRLALLVGRGHNGAELIHAAHAEAGVNGSGRQLLDAS